MRKKSKAVPAEAPTAGAANALWGGRFEAGPAAIMQQINASIDVDKRLYAEDIAGSRAIPNRGNGVLITDGTGNMIGGTVLATR